MSGNEFYIMALAIAGLVLWRRTRSMHHPIRGNGTRLLIPLLIMLPLVSLVFNQNVHEPARAFVAAFGLGLVLSIPLIWTTHFEVREDNRIYARKNWGFVAAFAGIVIIRLALRQELSGMDPADSMALFVTVALGYIIPWRIVSFIRFRRLVFRLS